MKIQFLLFLFSILTCNIFAQSNSIGVFGGINISNVNLSNTTNIEHPDWNGKFDGESLIGFSGGVKYQRVFKIPIVLDIGVAYNQYGYYLPDRTGDSYSIVVNGQITNITIVDGFYLYCIFNYLSAPILVGYKMGKSFSFIPKFGLQPSILMNVRNKTKWYDNEFDLKQYNKFDLAGVVELELCYSFNDNWGIFACFDGKYSFTNYMKLNNDSVAKHYLFSTVCGVKYSF